MSLRAYLFSFAIAACLAVGSLAHAREPDRVDCRELGQGPLVELKGPIQSVLDPLQKAYFGEPGAEFDVLQTDFATIQDELNDDRSKDPQPWLTYRISGGTPASTTPMTTGLSLLQKKTFVDEKGNQQLGTIALAPNKKNVWVIVDDHEIETMKLRLGVKDFSTLSIEQLQQALLETNSYNRIPPPFPSATVEDALRNAAYLKFLDSKTNAQMDQAFAQAGKVLPPQQLVNFFVQLYDDLGDRYDQNRTQFLKGYQGSNPPEEILANVRNPSTHKMDVCRGLGTAMGYAMKKAGLRDIYIATYNSNVPHVAIIARDPRDPSRLLTMESSTLSGGALSDETAAVRLPEDFSTNYMLYNADGKAVGNLPTELGLILQEQTGGIISELDPFARTPSASITQLTLHRGRQAYPIFYGETSTGDRVVGVANTHIKGTPTEDRYALRTSVAGVHQTQTQVHMRETIGPNSRGSSEQPLEVVHLNARVTQYLNTDWKTVYGNPDRSLQGRVATTATAEASPTLVLQSVNSEDGVEVGFNGSLRAEPMIQTRYRSAKTQADITVGFQSALTPKDPGTIRPGDFRPVITTKYVSVNAKRKITPELQATFDAVAGIRKDLGAQMRAMGGVQNTSGTRYVRAGYQGSLEKNAFTIAPGSHQRIVVQAKDQVTRGIGVDFTIEIPIEANGGTPQARAGISGAILPKKKKRARALSSPD